MRWLTSVHGGSGHHSSKAPMLNAPSREGASLQLLRVAEDFQCDAHAEANHHRPTQAPVRLEPMPPKWKRIQPDQS
eukprot:1535345-Pyramimonas_sp.AAC.1